MTKADEEDGRRGRRRIQPRPVGAYPGVSRDLVIAARGEALPGEDGPLRWEQGRDHPVTDAEALGVWRRKKRAEIAKDLADGDEKALKKLARQGLPAAHEAQVPQQLPAWDSKKVPVTMRMHPRLRAMVDALGELEETNFAAEVELALWKLVTGVPRDPDEVRRELADMISSTIMPERVQRQLRR
jgi:hypothetical protein